jgi:glycogen operon protein
MTSPPPGLVQPGRRLPLGASWDGSGTNFALWARDAEAVELCLFDAAGAEQRLQLGDHAYGAWHGYVPGVRPGQRYGYRVHGPWFPEVGHRFNPAKLLLDPYARAVDGRLVVADEIYGHTYGLDDAARDDRDSAPYVPRSVVTDPSFDWGDDRPPDVPWPETVIYEAHVRGLTMRHPDVPEHLRGTYAGLAHPAVVEHLTSLGVTAVELLPVHQFVSEAHLLRRGRTNYWGYCSMGFFAPHNAYSSAGTAGEQVHEFKQMVRTLHTAGLEVLLDVVYNHTSEGDERGPTLSFRGIANADYYRLRGGRHYADFTGTGNTLDVTQPDVLRLVMDSLRYWVTEMHVDGFRFDLAPALARMRPHVDLLGPFMQAVHQDPVLSRVKLIAEPWDVGDGGYQVGRYPPPWTEWNDRYRDNVRDYWRGASAGVRDLAYRLSGSSDLYRDGSRPPFSSVNFVTAHDGFTLRDLVSYDRKHNIANGEDGRDGTNENRSWNCGVEGYTTDEAVLALRDRQVRNFLTTLLVSTGVPMLLAGDEIGRSQQGNNNAYCQDNEMSWVDWEDIDDRRASLLEFSRRVIALRRKHAVLRQQHFFDGRPVHPGGPKDIAWFAADGSESVDWWAADLRTLGMFVTGGPDDASFLFLAHAGAEPHAVTLPGGPYARAYEVEIDTARQAAAGRRHEAGATVSLGARSCMLLRAERPD